MEAKIHTLTLEETVYTPDQLKASALLTCPQIALAGRSNVGKSSLINALAVRKQLAKVSSTPGKTASVNFYRVEPGGYYLVDLPGYGYAQRSKTEREKWSKLIDAYLRESPAIRLLAVLLDSRLEPQSVDLDLISYAASLRLELLPVLTKADKCNQKERSARKAQWAKLLQGKSPVVTSASGPVTKRIGIEQLWRVLDGVMGVESPEPDAAATHD